MRCGEDLRADGPDEMARDCEMIGAFQEMSIDFTADQPGLSLFHCHMQHHMDFGFMALFECS